MKCPHCNYIHGYENVDGDFQSVHGDDGDFWASPVQMERGPDGYTSNKEQTALLACPSCCKTFIQE